MIAYQSQTVVSLSWYTGRGATVIRYQQLYILRFIWPNGAEALFTYLPTGRYDCTAFMETGSVGLRCNLIGVLVFFHCLAFTLRFNLLNLDLSLF